MKSLVILESILHDASLTTGASTTRDWITILSRSKDEGLSFLTITLPIFATWLEESIEQKKVSTSIYHLFRQKKVDGSVVPCFLQGLTRLIFDEKSGLILEESDPSAVYFIRQICNFFKKVELPCTPARNRAAVEKFVATDSSLPEELSLDRLTISVANVFLEDFTFGDLHEQCLPRHGPGATVEKLWGNQKYNLREFYLRWKGIIDPVDLYGWAGSSDIATVSPDLEKPCRLSLVRKTQKSPRTIAVEPTAMQYAQQFCASRIIVAMASHPLTRHIDFRDQSRNRSLAEQGSRDGSLCTIDLSEASDRVSVALVKELFKNDPNFLAELMAFRTIAVTLPDGRVLPLRKFSTSGSALTFPVETLVFFLLSLSAVVKDHLGSGESVRTLIHRWAQSVHVYGDDIVVPAESCETVVSLLESYGLKVNRNKTFAQGFFRESCGGDFFKGYDVTPKYLRHFPDNDRTVATGVASLVSTSNQLFFAGCWHAADAIRKRIDSSLRLPLVKRTCGSVGWHTYENAYEYTKILPDFGIRVRTYVVRTKPLKNVLDGLGALVKHLISVDTQEDPEHLQQSLPRFRSTARVMWTLPY
jgi:hypothetical protein